LTAEPIRKSIANWFWIYVFIWTLVHAISLTWSWHEINQNTETFALQEANTRFEDIVVARAWNAQRGGLYGRIDHQSPPNPHLKGLVKERDITTPSGVRLTLINPAYMTRQLNELLEKRLGLMAHITSLKPIRPANAADVWETQALESFEHGETEAHEVMLLNDRQQMRLMRPLRTEKACLQCHAQQGYKEGDIRGGISVSIPIDKHIAIAYAQKESSGILHGIIWLIGLVGLGVGRRRLSTANRKHELAQEKFRLVFHNSSDAIFIHDFSGHIIDINEAASALLQYSREELLQMKIVDLHPDKALGDAKRAFTMMRKKNKAFFHIAFRRKDGSTFMAEVSANSFQYDDKEYIQGAVRDITERIKAEDKIRLLSSSLEQANEAIIITDETGAIEYVNQAFATITGYNSSEVIGKNPRLLSSGQQGKSFYEDMWNKLNRGESWQGRVVDKKKDGSFYPALLSISPIQDQDGNITHFVGIQQDMKDYEDLEAQFLQAQKMEAIGTLVGGIAHDFNNTLAGMTGNLFLAQTDVEDRPKVKKRLRNVEKLAFGASAMIEQLLTFARKGMVSRNPMTISSFLKETIKIQKVALPEDIDLVNQIDPSEMMVNADINILQQVMINLINNARDAVSHVDNPCITIALHYFQASKHFSKKHGVKNGAEFAVISVTDNGCGIAEDDIEHIFEPFFTTKGVGEGTGLGLSMIYGAIQTHEGIVEVESEPAVGSRFSLYFPLLENGEKSVMIKTDTEVKQGQGEMILLVDDERSVVDTTKEVLLELNYKILTANNGVEAVETYLSHKNEIDIVILDVVMPRMGGIDAAYAIRKINSKATIIFASGYDQSTTLKGLKRPKHTTVLRKPYSISSLSQLLREYLDK